MNTNETADLIAGKIRQPLWENWYIKEKIGSGTFCNVYRIEAKRINRTDTAALKIEPILAEERFSDNEERKISYIEKRKQSVVNETEIMYMLKDCPNIVAYQEEDMREFYIDGKFEGYYFLVRMELLENVHMLIIHKQFDLSENNVLKLAREIGNGIKSAHSMNVLHRDIKPENLFVSQNGVYKLGDFNISKRATSARSVAGTPQYMSPEIDSASTNINGYTAQADIYSFGICLYQMMNDYLLPFEENFFDDDAINKRRSGVPLPPPKNASPEFSYIILKACAFNQQQRYHSIDEMLYDLNHINSISQTISNRTEYARNDTMSVPFPNPNPVPYPTPIPAPNPFPYPAPNTHNNKTAKSILTIFIILILLVTVGISAFILFGDRNSDDDIKSDRNTTTKYSESKDENPDDSESSETSETPPETYQEILTESPVTEEITEPETEPVTEAEPSDYPPSFSYISATSELPSISNNDGNFYYNISNVTDDNYSTCWAEGTSDAGINESILMSADRKQHVSEITITNGYYKNEELFYKNNRVKNCKFEFSDGTSQEVTLLGEYSEQSNLIVFDPPVDTEYIKITILSIYPGNKYNDTCISEISVK
ncbi:MAG: protein kinase [Ruminococcus sp.]|nr:protein kinase [Ruminococcus sp.]